jgi:integrase
VSLKRNSRGEWEARYYEDGTKGSPYRRDNLGKITYQEASKLYKQKLANAAARRGRAKQHVRTVRELALRYLEDHGHELRGRGADRARDIIERLLLPEFGDLAIERLDSGHVKRYRDKRTKAGVKPATINREWNVLKAVLNFGETVRLIDRNPIPRQAVKALRTEGPREEFFEPEEWQRFLAAFDDEARWQAYLSQLREKRPVRMQATVDGGKALGKAGIRPGSDAAKEWLQRLRGAAIVFRALFYACGRAGEVTGLRWEDVDYRRGTVRLYQEKVDRWKVLPLIGDFRGLLQTLPAGIGKALVFPRPDGERYSNRELQRAFALALKFAGIEKHLTPHSIRHTVSSWLTAVHYPREYRQEILGHARSTVTDGYSHIHDQFLIGALDRVAKVAREGWGTNAATLGQPFSG